MEEIRSRLNKGNYSSDDDFSNECNKCQITFDKADDLRKHRCKKRKQIFYSNESDKTIKDLAESIKKLSDKIEIVEQENKVGFQNISRDTITNTPIIAKATVKQIRKDPNILTPGFILEIEGKAC